MLSFSVKRGFFIVLALIIICAQQAMAFTPYQFQCAEEGDLGGTCFYDPSAACSTTSFGPGTLPSYIEQPYNSIFTAAAAAYNINPAALVAIFYNEQYGVGPAESAFQSHTMPTPPPPYGDGVPWASSGVAYGPFQFETGTWATEGVSANGQGGTPNIEDLADSAFSAAHYLSDGDLGIKVTASSTGSQFAAAASTYNGGSSAYGASAETIYEQVLSDEGVTTPTTPTTPESGCGTVSTSCAVSTGNAVILCEAEQYKGIYYVLGGGHDYASFETECPASVLATAASGSTADVPGPCATDCSGLVTVAVDSAFGQNFSWDVAGIENDKANWQKLPNITSVQPGDVVTEGSDTHVEIVESYNSSTNTLTTFGSHAPGQTTGPDTSVPSYWTGGAYKYIGPTSSSS
jgi:hypothetical protein